MTTPPLGVWSEVGKLHQVMVCAPGLAHERLTPSNCGELLFDDVLWVDEAKKHHAEFVAKLRSYGVEVLEMHKLLEETLDTPGGRDLILDYKLLDKNVGAGIGGELRHWFNEMPTARLAELLIGGLPFAEIPKGLGRGTIDAMREVYGPSALHCARCPTRSTRAITRRGFMVGSPSTPCACRRATRKHS